MSKKRSMKPIRLHFTDDELSNHKIKKAANKAEKATNKAEKAVEKVKKQQKLRPDSDISAERKAKLRFGKAKNTEPEKPVLKKRPVERTVSSTIYNNIDEYENDNVGVKAVNTTEKTAETAYYVVNHSIYGHKIKSYNKAEKLVGKSDKANVNALFEKFKSDNPNASSNPLSRWKQKQNIKKEYAAKVSKGSKAAKAKSGMKKSASSIKSIGQKLANIANKKVLLIILLMASAVMLFLALFSSCATLFSSGGQVVVGTSFTAEDEDILGVDEDYTAMENALRNEIDNIENTHSGYDEYRYHLDEIGHNPYELASYLTVVYEAYTREQVQEEIAELFEAQYDLTLRTIVERRSRTTTNSDGSTSITYYNYYILDVTLVNKGLATVIDNAGLTDDQKQRYDIILELKGNRPDLFDDIYTGGSVGTGEYTDYDIPSEALTDTAFANMIREAEKYLGYPYVWGGSSPSTSFDCSGFVSWVINHCGNGWNVGRETANGLKNLCNIIPPSEAKPGDLIFFQGTYNTSGASHVGIYVGNGTMIHCGNPISYTSINTSYWQSHFYCYGRLP